MRPFNDDIVAFIHANFTAQDAPKAIEILRNNGHVLTTPRIQRAVLFLSGGSLAILRHYVTAAALDVRQVIIRSEYVMDLAKEPMHVRSMEDAFDSNGAGEPSEPPGTPAPPQRAPRRSAVEASYRHRHLVNRRFVLGNVAYTVTHEQLHDDRVRCLRRSGNVMSIVHLPLIFVMEQLSEEHIEFEEHPLHG